MRPSLPLSAKILFWFFLNFALLAVVFVLLFNAQFHFDLNWLLASSARDRVNAFHDLMVGELNSSVPDDWDHVIERFSEAYHVHITLFDDDGDHLIGPTKNLPDEVRSRLSLPSRSTAVEHQQSTATNRDVFPRKPGRGRSLRELVRSTHPTQYWLVMTMKLDNPQSGPMRVLLVADSTSLGMGGLIVDLMSWLRLGMGAIAFSVLFWFPLLRGITRSIGKMRDATQRLAEGRFDVRLSSRRRDELGSLAEAINQMAVRLDGLVNGQKRFLGDVAHELCSPLARLQMALGIIEQRAGDSQKTYVISAMEKAGQISALVNELLVFSKASLGSSSVHLERVDVKSAVNEAVQREIAEGDVVNIDVSDDLGVLADPELLVRALGNLLRNAVRHGKQSSGISIKAVESGGTVAITVADCGPGVPEEELSRIFDAFYRLDVSRTRETGGVGLGLTIVKSCVESCRGSIKACNRHPHGLEVTISLPAAER